MSDGAGKLRLDKWLWQARFFKTRSLAAKVVSAGHVRLNGQRVAKPAVNVGAADILTFPQGRVVRVIRVLALGERRGPAPEAQTLYDDLDPPKAPDPEAAPMVRTPRYDGKGRPTKRDRRKLDESRGEVLD